MSHSHHPAHQHAHAQRWGAKPDALGRAFLMGVGTSEEIELPDFVHDECARRRADAV